MSSCSYFKRSATDISKISNDEIFLNNWLVIGPFESDNSCDFFDKNNLSILNCKEDSISDDIYLTLYNKRHPLVKRVTTDYIVDFNKLYGTSDENSTKGNVYCVTMLKSDRERNVFLNFSSDDGAKIWLNNKLIHNINRPDDIHYFEYLKEIRLQAGNNIITVKVNNTGMGWKMFASILLKDKSVNEKFKKAFSANFGSYHLQRSWIKNDTLALNETLPINECNISITAGKDNNVICKRTFASLTQTLRLNTLKDGLYISHLNVLDNSFEEEFYKGDLIQTINELLTKFSNTELDEQTRRNIEALSYRFNFLLKPSNQGNSSLYDKRDWDKKLISLYKQLFYYDTAINSHLKPGVNAKGEFIKSYISNIDNSCQYYFIHVPDNYDKNVPIPVFIEMPTVINRQNSYLETQRVALVRLHELHSRMANKYKMIVLQPHNRTLSPNMNSIDEADFWEVVENVKKEYNIDTSRLYLNGQCQAGKDALRFAVKYPDKFAAVTLIAPRTSFDRENMQTSWQKQNEPSYFLENIRQLPILDIYSKMDPHTPYTESELLKYQANKSKLNKFTINEVFEIRSFYDIEYLEDAYQFCRNEKVDYSPKSISFSTTQLKYNKSFWLTINQIDSSEIAKIDAKIYDNNLSIRKSNIKSFSIDLNTLPWDKENLLKIYADDTLIYNSIPNTQTLTFNSGLNTDKLLKTKNIEGPFAHVFTVPFVLVTGTEGSKFETDLIKNIANKINEDWKTKYYNGCRIIDDTLINADNIKNLNLILLGRPESNQIIKRVIPKLPITVANDFIKIGNTTVRGKNLSYYLIYPNPLNLSKYTAIIGNNNPSRFTLGYEFNEQKDASSIYYSEMNEISNYGWYDFKIWNSSRPEKTLLKGYFNTNWE